MDVRWTEPAAQDLDNIARHIRRENPAAALRVVRELYDRATSLEDFPNRGRIGRITGTRELVSNLYVIVYRVTSTVEILRIHHAAQERP
jgi:addiction module RelE/StbE family toxin